MKTLTWALLGFLAFTFSSEADVLIYNQKITVTQTGAGTVSKIKVSGWLVLDPQTLTVVSVRLYTDRLRFRIQTASESDVETISGKKGAKSLVMAFNGNGTGGFVAKGTVSKTTLYQGLVQPYNIPKVLTITGSLLSIDANDDPILSEWKGSLTYSMTDTVIANGSGYTLDDTVEAIRGKLLGLGYTEEN